MADATQGDTGVQFLGLLAPALIALIAGLLIHLFIIGVNVTDWWEGRSVTAVDHIVTCLEVSRVCAQCSTILHFFTEELSWIKVDSYIILLIMDTIHYFVTYANFCLTSLLSIVLCLKISNFHSRLFLYLRGLIVHRTGSLIVAPGLLSAVNSLLLLLLGITEVTKHGTYNTTLTDVSMHCTNIHSIYIYTMGAFIPLLFYCISSVLLFSSLYHHTTKMKMSSNLSINLETYYSAMKLVSVTFIYNTLYLIGYLAYTVYYFFLCLCPAWLYIFFEFLPIVHSSYLMYRTAKLRSHMSKVLHNVTDFLFQRKDTETGENIEVAQ